MYICARAQKEFVLQYAWVGVGVWVCGQMCKWPVQIEAHSFKRYDIILCKNMI